jgi:hypothetical protein
MDEHAWETVRLESEDVRLPFEVRCNLRYEYELRSWPGGKPVTASEKIRWRILKDRNPLLATFADKLAARDYVAGRVGPEILARVHAVAEDPDELDFDALPREFVLKPSHGSGAVWVVTDQARPGGVLPVNTWNPAVTHPDSTDRARMVAAARGWLASNLGREALEWAYLDVEPRLLVEELLPWRDGDPPTELKLWTFHGQVRMIRHIRNSFTERRAATFSRNWEVLEARSADLPLDQLPLPPDGLDRMIEIAERLGREIDFVRVDLYDSDGRIVFGELTNYPWGGWPVWEPAFDEWLGSWWHVG